MNRKLGLMLGTGCGLLSQAAYSETGNPERGDRPSREAMLLGFIHQANQNEVALAKLAQQNSNSAQVKDFANRMITDHTQADDQVLAFADSHNISVPSIAQINAVRADRTELANRNKEIGSETGEYAFCNVGTGGSGSGSDFQATMDKLRGLKGPDFDREFARAMIKDHQSLIDRLNNALTPDAAGPYVTQARITDPDAIKLVEQLLPTVKQHLSLAKQLNDGLNG